MKQGGLLRTLAMVELAFAAGLRVVIGHGFGLTLSTLAEAAVGAVSEAIADGCEAGGAAEDGRRCRRPARGSPGLRRDGGSRHAQALPGVPVRL